MPRRGAAYEKRGGIKRAGATAGRLHGGSPRTGRWGAPHIGYNPRMPAKRVATMVTHAHPNAVGRRRRDERHCYAGQSNKH